MLKVGNCKHGTPCVYEIRNTVTGRVYIGSTPRFSIRFTEHKRLLEANKHHSRKLQLSYNKHGAAAFVMKVVEVVSHPAFIHAREQYWIERHKFKNTYNSAPVAMGSTRVPEGVFSIDPQTGSKVQFASAMDAASVMLGSPEKATQIRKAMRNCRKAGGQYWTKDASECLPAFIARKRQVKHKTPRVFAFTTAGELVNQFATIAAAAEHYRVSCSAISQSIRNQSFRTAAGLVWNNTETPKAIVSKKTKPVVQKRNGIVVAVWSSCLEASQSVAGASVNGISSAATGRHKSHRGYQWEFAKS